MHKTNNSPKPLIAKIIAVLAFIVCIATFFWFHKHQESNLSSDDAVIQANLVHISPAVPGQIAELHVQDGARVRQGDLLFRLDSELYQWRVEQAKAELAIAQAALHTRGRVVKAESANATIAQEQITRAQTNLALAKRTVERLRPLVAKGYATQQELDIALTAERDAQISLSQAGSQNQAAQHLVGQVDAAQAGVQVAQAAVAMAEKALKDTEVRAPHNGLVVGLRVGTGERLIPDQSLFTLIDTKSWYAQALFLETEIAQIPLGACASVFVLADPKHELKGKVVNIGWGVNSEEVISLPRSLPYVQKSLNWVRVAQRFPVRIQLEEAPDDLMRVGASATVTIRAQQSCS